MKTALYLLVVSSIMGCGVTGSYKWAHCEDDGSKTTQEISSDQNVKFGRWDVAALKLKSFGVLNYRFTKSTSDGGVAITQDRPWNKGKWEIKKDTLSIFYSIDKSDPPNLYRITGDTLIPLNNRSCWQKKKRE